MLAAMGMFNEDLAAAGIIKIAEGLKATSHAKRVAFDGSDRTGLDGPFVPVNGLVAGFWIWELKAMDEAVAWLKRCPNPMSGPSEIEIRPFHTAEDFGKAMTPELAAREAALRGQTQTT